MKYNIEYFNKTNFIKKFDRIIEVRYRTEKADTENKQRSAFYSAYKKKYPNDEFDISSSVRQWRSYNNKQLPKLNILMKLCSILKCDIDYFLTDQNDFKKDTQHASETTGLDYATIEKIEEYPPEVNQLIDRLVLHTKEDNLLKLLNAIHAYSLESYHAYIKIDVPGADIFETNDIEEKLINASSAYPLKDISKKMLKYSVTSTLDEILSDTYNDYIEDGNLLLHKRLEKEGELEKAVVKHVFDLVEAGIALTTPEDFRLYYGNSIDNHTPDLNERYNQIDEKVSSLYKLYKEPSKSSK